MIYIKNIQSVLEQHQVYYGENTKFKEHANRPLSSPTKEILEDIFTDLEGIQFPSKIPLRAFAFENEDYAIVFNDESHFNRYRSITLRAPFYKQMKLFSYSNYLSQCRKYERECLKAAAAPFKWHTKESEQVFGTSEDAGDLGLKGSSMWKWTAFIDLYTDLLAHEADIKLLHLSIYDQLMIGGQLQPLHQLLLNPKERERELVFKYITRKLAL